MFIIVSEWIGFYMEIHNWSRSNTKFYLLALLRHFSIHDESAKFHRQMMAR